MNRDPSQPLHAKAGRLEESLELRHVSPESPCPYLPGKSARYEAYGVDTLSPETYSKLLAQGFRRSGHVVYRPRCRNCRMCKQIRVSVNEFIPSRSMRRVERLNADVLVEVGPLRGDVTDFNLFCRYLDAQHDSSMERSFSSFRAFLAESPTTTVEFRYRIGQQTVGVSVADRCADGISSVYMYFDPDFGSRSLGVYSVLREVAYCQVLELPYYYLGYWVEGSAKMDYKARYTPNEILSDQYDWTPFRR